MFCNQTEAVVEFNSFSEKNARLLHDAKYEETIPVRTNSLVSKAELSSGGFKLDLAPKQRADIDLGPSEDPWLFSDQGVIEYSKDAIDVWVSSTDNHLSYWWSPLVPNGLAKYLKRIKYLRFEAELEGISVNQESVDDFMLFLEKNPWLTTGSLVLTEEGELRALWKVRNSFRLALQFKGGELLQFVIFRKPTDSGSVLRAAGTNVIQGFKQLIEAFDMRKVLET